MVGFAYPVSAAGNGRPHVVSALGIAKVGGQDVMVDVLVEVPPGQNAREVAREALRQQGARPFESASLGSEGFTLTGLVWDAPPVVQNYNPGSSKTKDEPASLNSNGQTALTNTHTTWDGVATSSFGIGFGEITDRCPSLVRECRGRQNFDGNNDVAWLKLGGSTLGVAWFGTSIDEVDIALNTNFNWKDGCTNVDNSFDAQTVFLHENGHTVGLGHSDDTGSVMQPFYHGVDCDLSTDDKEGITYLYDSDVTGSVFGTVTDDANNLIEGATVVLEDTGLSATTMADGTYTISGVPDPVTYTVTASADGFESATIARKTVSGAVTGVNLALTPTGGGGGGGGNTGTLIIDITHGPDDAPQGKDGQYVNKDRVHIFITVTDENGPVAGAAVHVTIVTPKPITDVVGDFTTDANGEVHFHYKVNSKRDGVSPPFYHIKADASTADASGSCTHDDGACHADFEVTP